MRACAVLVLVAVLGGCHCEQQARCLRASGDEAACRAMSDDCNTVIDSRCVGDCPIRCAPNDVAGRCELRGPCVADARIFDGRRVGDLPSFAWKAKALSPAALALANRSLTRDDFDALTPEDRRQLCSGIPNDPCALVWDAQGFARCAVPEDACARCQLVSAPVKCIPINKCSGVICL